MNNKAPKNGCGFGLSCQDKAVVEVEWTWLGSAGNTYSVTVCKQHAEWYLKSIGNNNSETLVHHRVIV